MPCNIDVDSCCGDYAKMEVGHRLQIHLPPSDPTFKHRIVEANIATKPNAEHSVVQPCTPPPRISSLAGSSPPLLPDDCGIAKTCYEITSGNSNMKVEDIRIPPRRYTVVQNGTTCPKILINRYLGALRDDGISPAAIRKAMLHSKETITTKFSIDTSGNKALDSATLGKAGHSSSRKVNMDPSRDGKKSPGSANSGGGNFTARKSFTVVGYANEIYNRCVRVEDWKFNSHLVDIWDISPTEIRKKLFQKFNLLTNGAPEDLEKLKGEYIILSGLDEMDGDSIDIKPLSDDEIFAICRGAVGPSRCSLRLVKISAISDYRQNLSRYMIQKNLRHLSPFHSISKAFKPRLHTSSSSVEQSTSSYSVMNNKVNNSIKHFILSSSKRLLKHVTTSPQHERGEGAQKHHKPGRELWRYEGSSPAIANNFSDSDANLTSECARSGVRLDIKPDQFSSVSTESTHSKCSSTPLPVDDDRSFEYKNNESFEMEGGACVSADETRMTLLRDFHQLFGTSDRPPSHIICKNIELFFPGLKFEKVVSDIFLNGSDKFSCSNIADGLPREEARHEEIFPGPRDLKLSVNINTPVLSTVEGDNHKYSAENQENSVLNRASIVNTKVYNSEDITKLAKFTLIQCQKKRLRDLKRTSFGRRASQHLFATISGVNEGTYAAGSSLCRPVNNVNGTESKKRNGSVSISPSDALGFQGVPCSIPCTSMSDKMISSAYSESNGSVRNNGYSENRDSTIDGYRNPQSVDPFSLNCEGHLEVQKSLTCMDSSFCFMNSDSPDIFLDARSALTPETNLAITESADIHNHTGYNGICSYLESSLDNDNSGITKTQNESVDKAPAENISNSRRRNACSTITLSSNVMPYCSLDAVEDIQVGNYYEDSPINDLSRLLPQAGMLSAQNPAATIYLSNIIYSDATPDDATLSGRSNGTPVNFDELHFDENTPHRSAGNVKGGGYNAFKTDVDSTITSNDNGEIHQNLKISSLCSKDTTPKRIVWLKGPLIGKGSFGKVFYAVNMRTYEIMAVKQVDISGKNKGFTKRLIRSLKSEINLMRNISHENVVSYTGFEVRDKTINIFLEYVSGGTVATALSSMGPFEQSLVRSVTCQVLCGLEYLHERNIIHRDIKGTNILLNEKGVAKISDFGVSKKSAFSCPYKTCSRMSFQGSVQWMAPEVIRSKGGYSAKVDIWSLGCVVIEMMTGNRPWSSFDQMQTMWKLGKLMHPEFPKNIDKSAKSFLKAAFTTNPKQRPTASEMLKHPFADVDPAHFDFEAYKAQRWGKKKNTTE